MKLHDREKLVKEIVDLVDQGYSATEAGQIMGVSGRTGRRLSQEGRAYQKTVQTDAEGNVVREWTRYRDDPDKVEMIMESLKSQVDKIPPVPEIRKPDFVMDDLCTVYTITDFHLGMYAWGEETGEDWDLNIATKTWHKAIENLVGRSPNSKFAILNQLGDFLHWDGHEPLTPTSKNVLDADSRYFKMADRGIDLMRFAIDVLALKHEHVIVWNVEGNHDAYGSALLTLALSHIYQNNDRISVDTSPSPYHAHLHGEIMIAAHHGHKLKIDKLPAFFASDPRYRKMWGEAMVTYIHTGHMHHERVTEGSGAIVEQHPTLAARDAYAARGGWVSRRAAKSITYDKREGEIMRSQVTP